MPSVIYDYAMIHVIIALPAGILTAGYMTESNRIEEEKEAEKKEISDDGK